MAVFHYNWFQDVMESGNGLKPTEWACLQAADIVVGGIDFTYDYWFVKFTS